MSYLLYAVVPDLELNDKALHVNVHEEDSDIEPRAAPLLQRTPWRAIGAVLLVACVTVIAVLSKTSRNSRQYFPGDGVFEATLLHEQETTTKHRIMPDNDACRKFEHISLERAIYSNLGRKGPDAGPEGMVFKAVAVKPVSSLDGKRPHPSPVMVVINASTAMNLATDSKYNGMIGQYARLNLNHGTSLLMTVKFLDGLTMRPKVLQSLDLTFFDLGAHSAGNELDYLKVWGYSSFALAQNSTLTTEVDPTDGSATFEASASGTTLDGPVDPALHESVRKDKAVTLHFEDVSEIQVELGSIDKTPHQGGHRTFIFNVEPFLRCGQATGTVTTSGTTSQA